MNKLVRLKLSRNYRRPASLLEKKKLLRSFFCFSSNNSQSFFPFFVFNYIVLFSFCTQIFLFTRCEVAENDTELQAVTSKQLAISELRREIGYLTKFGALRLNRDQVMTLETWLKIHTNVCNFVTASPKTILTLNFFMISVIFLKMGKHSDFRISSFQVVDG